MVIVQYLATLGCSLLMLTLFDSNSWWIVALFAAAVSGINLMLSKTFLTGNNLPLLAVGQGAAGALLAYLFGFTPLFRTTFGTLIGYALILALGQYLQLRIYSSGTN